MPKVKLSDILEPNKKPITKTTPRTPILPRPSSPRTSKTAQINLEKINNTITKDDLQTFKDDVLKHSESIQKLTNLIEKQQDKLKELEPASIHIFNERNALFYVSYNERTGYKPKKMFDFFLATDGSVLKQDIKTMDQYFQKNGLISVSRTGWRRLTKKGLARLEKLQQRSD